MPSSIPSNEQDASEPVTPRKAPAANKDSDASATTPRTPLSPADNPRASPAAAGARPRGNSRKQDPPTLLADFLKGRPSPARVAADRTRRRSVDVVKAEMRQEMRQQAVRKVQPPSNVKNRVKEWQQANAAAMTSTEDAATEPSDLAFHDDDEESVNEEDRVRIKHRKKKKRTVSRPKSLAENESKQSEEHEDATANDGEGLSPPKKRVVSDDNWVKPKARKSPSRRKVSPKMKKAASPVRMPKERSFQPKTNNPMSNKIQAWADKVEIVDTKPPRSYRSSKSHDQSIASNDHGSEVMSESAGSSSQATAKDVKVKMKPKSDDGIRVKPVRRKKLDDDGIRVTPISSATGASDSVVSGASSSRRIRLQPISKARERSKSTGKLSARIEVFEEASDLSKTSSGGIEAQEDSESAVHTPTRRRAPQRRMSGKTRPKSYDAATASIQQTATWASDEDSCLSSVIKDKSEITSSLAAKSIADIPGEIPFGHSAFSELDLPLRGAARSVPKRPNVDRKSSFKAMPSMFKKVVSEGKKMIHEMNEAPRQPAENKPPSIEKWLSTTVDPFVEQSTVEKKAETNLPAAAKNAERDTKTARRPSQGADTTRHSAPPAVSPKQEKSAAPTTTSTEETPEPETAKQLTTPTSSGLKRRKATRSATSPAKSAEKRPFFGVLKEVFQGESAGHSNPMKGYQSFEQRGSDDVSDIYDDSILSGSQSTWTEDLESSVRSDSDVGYDRAGVPRMSGPRFRPPTKGNHELSTIISEEDSSVGGSSDLTSDLSNSTLTQSTNLTKDSDLSRKRSQGSGLKRRLTKHSDLVSALSLPDDSRVPERIKSNRSRPSQRRARGNANDVTIDDLVREFSDDEDLYQRELKTLVDGVIPVLLSHVVSGANAADLLGPGGLGKKPDALSKSVVNMGVALEKLKHAHKKAPVSDLRRVSHWAHGVVPIYNSYLSAWRMGFQDLVVNLAPVAERLDEDDSLIGALPRNDHGDIVGANGERVDVAYLLKRPLLRIKQMVKLLRCVDSIYGSNDTSELVRDFENLQEKARRRYREEMARMADEEAINTDTTRSRDLQTFDALDNVVIDPRLQVNAKDIFSLDLAHSNGQRLECKAELVLRDCQKSPDVTEDLLIREVGDGRNSYLLFAPVPISSVSARTGEGNFDMVVMIRGEHLGRKWHELLTLTAEDEDQILDWLDMLPLNPVPPREPEPSIFGDEVDDAIHDKRRSDIPVGARKSTEPPQHWSRGDSTPASPSTPTRRTSYGHHRSRDSGSFEPSRSLSGPDTTPTKADLQKTPRQSDHQSPPRYEKSRRPVDSGMPEKHEQHSPNSTPYREDGAPPPPVHRTLSNSGGQSDGNEVPSLKPPTDRKKSDGLKRRTSSPLKHEYLPSDGSSTSEFSPIEEESESDLSSDDDLDSVDIPETDIGVSIRDEDTEIDDVHERTGQHEASGLEIPPPLVESALSGSICSLTPSNSASQAGLHGPKAAEENATRYMAAISRWSEKGAWKDMTKNPCSVVVTAGLIEAYPFQDPSNGKRAQGDDRPLVALDLTPLVLIRQSTALDLEIRSSVKPHCKLSEQHGGGNFRFRCFNAPECFNLYMSVHHARLNNQKFIELENEARFRSFGEHQRNSSSSNNNSSNNHSGNGDDGGDNRNRRRSWFGRKNSYRSSVRAPPQSQDGASTTPSSSPSASSFLKRLTGAGNMSFNIARSSLDKQSHGGSGGNSLYTSGSSSNGASTPRSPSVSIGNSAHSPMNGGSENIRIRLHQLASANKWEDFGNCSLQIRRPPPGWHQALRADHGLEKRVTVTTMPRKDEEAARILLDAVLGSGCFTPMGNRGIVCGVWEEMRSADGVVGEAPATGATGGSVKKWCLQFASAGEAQWVLRMVHQEVLRA